MQRIDERDESSGALARDLDLNLLRVFVTVADHGSVTRAASALYVTQPAVSAALRRLATAVGAPLLVRHGRGVALTARGARLAEDARPHLVALARAARAAPVFDPATSDRTLRLGLSDAFESWLLPRLLARLARVAPGMRFVAVPVQFRSVADALVERRVDLAVTVADELPRAVRRLALARGTFVCLYDPRHVRAPRGGLDRRRYFAEEHVVVSYAGDLRGVVEDLGLGQRRVRCSVSSFAHVGALVDGTRLVATVPELVADDARALRPHLRAAPAPFALRGAATELLWTDATDDDEACRFVREAVVALVAAGVTPEGDRPRAGPKAPATTKVVPRRARSVAGKVKT